jgi:PAS domain S-box-containing protein
VRSGKSLEYEAVHRPYSNTSSYWLTRLTPLTNGDGEVFRIIGSTMEITDRKLFEQELRASEERFQIISDISSDYAYYHEIKNDGSLEPVWHIGSFDSITGYTPEELYAMGGWSNLIHPDDVPGAEDYIKKLLSGKEATYTARIVTKPGPTKWIKDTGKPWKDEQSGKVIGIYGSAVDITEQKEISKKYELIAENSSDLITLFINKEISYVSPSIKKLLGYTEEEFIALNHIDLIHPEDLQHVADKINYRIDNRIDTPYTYIYRQKHKDGTYRWLESKESRKIFEGNNVITILNTRDISERKAAEEKIEKTLREKEYLMKELNHRVKNNLMMISSLVELKNTAVGKNVDLSDLVCQIEAITVIHDKLYQSETISHINIREYIEDLLSSIFSLSKSPVTIHSSVTNAFLNPRKAVPLGLIINEIATNAIKHGYTEKEERTFTLIFDEDKPKNEYVLTLANNGDPISEEITLDNPKTLGLRLIAALVNQLKGTIFVDREPNPRFSIRFPITVD